MKKLQWIFCIVLVIIGVSSFDQKVSATTLSISGDIITDSNTGLEWLVMSRTVNKSPDSIKNGTDGDNLAAFGWVHATIEQIETLLLDAGMTGLFNGMNSNENFAAAKFLMDLMGFTYEYQGEYGHSLSIQAFSAALGLSGLYTPVLIVGLEPNQVGGADVPGPPVPSSVASPTIGNWLVKGKATSNSPPQAVPGGTYEIFSPIILGGQVSDLDGDIVTYQWLEGNNILFDGEIQTVAGGIPVNLPEFTISYPEVGTYILTLSISDGINPPFSNSIAVSVIDDIAPTLAPLPNKKILWPPNHKMVSVSIAANASDNSGGPITLAATVSSNEPNKGLRDGGLGSDWTNPVINQDKGIISLQLRAECAGTRSDRIYIINITAMDQSGNSSTADVKILVPHPTSGHAPKNHPNDNRNK